MIWPLVELWTEATPAARQARQGRSGLARVPSILFCSKSVFCCAVLWCVPCRFDLSIHFGLPDEPCRTAILQQYAHQLSEADRHQIATVTGGFSGRDLRDVCEQVRLRV